MSKPSALPTLPRTRHNQPVHRDEFDILQKAVDSLKVELDAVKQEVGTSVEMTADVLVILRGFKLVAAAAKWITAVVVAALAVWQAIGTALHLK